MNMVSGARLCSLCLAVAALLTLTHRAAAGQGFVASGGANVHYMEAGPSTNGRALVLIPGWSTAANVWKKQIAYFSKSMPVVAIDPRSQGESSKTSDGNTPEQRARDYEAIFTALKLHDVILVGWSQGVQDVAAYVRQFGTNRLSGLVLVDAAVSEGSASVLEHPKSAQRLLAGIDVYAKHQRDYLTGMMQAIFVRKMSGAELDALVDTAMKTPANSGAAMLVADMLGEDLSGALKQFDKPTLIIASAGSSELTEQKAEMSALPHGTFVRIGHAGHGVFVDQPDEFNRALSKFIEQLPAR